MVVEEPLQAVSNAPERCSAPLTTTDVPLFEAEDEADPPIPTLAALQRDAEEPAQAGWQGHRHEGNNRSILWGTMVGDSLGGARRHPPEIPPDALTYPGWTRVVV